MFSFDLYFDFRLLFMNKATRHLLETKNYNVQF